MAQQSSVNIGGLISLGLLNKGEYGMLKPYIFLSCILFVVFEAHASDLCLDKYRWVYFQPGLKSNPLMEGIANIGVQDSRFEIEFISDKEQIDKFKFSGFIRKKSKLIFGELVPPNTESGFIMFRGEVDSQFSSCMNLPKSLWLVDGLNGDYIFLRK